MGGTPPMQKGSRCEQAPGAHSGMPTWQHNTAAQQQYPPTHLRSLIASLASCRHAGAEEEREERRSNTINAPGQSTLTKVYLHRASAHACNEAASRLLRRVCQWHRMCLNALPGCCAPAFTHQMLLGGFPSLQGDQSICMACIK